MSEDTLVAFNTEALKLSIMGVTIVVATGDNGAAANANYCNLRSGSFDYGFWDVSLEFCTTFDFYYISHYILPTT